MNPIEDAGQLRAAILERFDEFSPRLRQVAQFILDDPHSMGIETLAVTSARIGVHASAVVRFAKTLGFDGAGPMQRLLKDRLLEGQTESVYYRRAREFSDVDDQARPTPHGLLNEFSKAATISLEHVLESIDEESLDKALELIADATAIYVVGTRRSFPVATFLTYSLQQSGKRAAIFDSIGGIPQVQTSHLGPSDLVIGISYAPYAPETVDLVEMASHTGANILSITDTEVSPIGRLATVVLQARDVEMRGFRTLAASMCIAQTLAVAFAFRLPQASEESGDV